VQPQFDGCPVFLIYFIAIAILTPSIALAQSDKPASKTLSIGGVGQEPRFTLDISGAGRSGIVVVKNSAGAPIQTLSCDLFRDSGGDTGIDAETRARVFSIHDEIFVSGAKVVDANFDGLPDIMAVRDGGAKWGRYCVWLFDPKQGRFTQNSASRQMEDLDNLTVDAERRLIVSFTIGPTNPSRDEYRIDAQRLLPVRSCQLDTGSSAGSARVATIVTHSSGGDTVQRRTVSADCNDVCGDGCH
jgi:hypothetical protein